MFHGWVDIERAGSTVHLDREVMSDARRVAMSCQKRGQILGTII